MTTRYDKRVKNKVLAPNPLVNVQSHTKSYGKWLAQVLKHSTDKIRESSTVSQIEIKMLQINVQDLLIVFFIDAKNVSSNKELQDKMHTSCEKMHLHVVWS